MRSARPVAGLALAATLAWVMVALPAGPAVAATLAPRPQPGEGSDFTLHAGVDAMDFDLDPRGADALVAAGLDPRVAGGGLGLGVGWTFARPLRLDLTLGGIAGEVDREGVDCGLVRAVADLHVALAENRWAALEATVSLGGLVVVYTGAMDGEAIPGGEVGLGLTGRLGLPGALSLEAGYRWQHAMMANTTLELDGDGGRIAVHPTGRFHSVRVLLRLDL
jgi:hypothetical protein